MVTRSSLVWVMTGIAAGIAGGWLWNRERGSMSRRPQRRRVRSEPIRSPFTQRREERATYLTPSDASRNERRARQQLAAVVGVLSSSGCLRLRQPRRPRAARLR